MHARPLPSCVQLLTTSTSDQANMDTTIKPDTFLLGCIDVARAAAVEEAGADFVGDHVDAYMEDDRVATHVFACLNPAYPGWRWSVTLARVSRSRSATVNEVVLLPGDAALIAPPWVPWSERVQPGDLGPGDVLPTPADDVRLVAGLTGEDDLESVASLSPLEPGQWEIGLGRVRVLSASGRDDAADRWARGDFGPTSSMARQASLECATCGFMVPLWGQFAQQFALCANRMSPADGRVVALTYGCGAHSEVEVDVPAPQEIMRDDGGWDPVDLGNS